MAHAAAARPGRPRHRHRADRPVARRASRPRPSRPRDATPRRARRTPTARIVSVEEVDCGIDPRCPQTCANAVVEVLDGEGAGDFQQVELPPEVVAAGVWRRATRWCSPGTPAPRAGRPTASSTTSGTSRSSSWPSRSPWSSAWWRGFAVWRRWSGWPSRSSSCSSSCSRACWRRSRRRWSAWWGRRRSCSSSSISRTASPHGRRPRWSARCSGSRWSRSWGRSPSPSPG